ncbi:MAG: DPP IV N-terminal domain-containing protein [Acidobacteria bacterium]|nr:DPP IV N-terminal domain-containing protein [Acidobacteriota bacterium]
MSAAMMATTASILALAVVPASAQPAVDDYVRAASLQAEYSALVSDVADAPVWLEDGRFWYRKTAAGGHVFVVVDPTAPSKAPAFDHARLAQGFSAVAGRTVSATSLPFSTFALADAGATLTFAVENTSWRCSLTTYTCAQAPSADDGNAGPGASQGARADSKDAARPAGVTSPNGQLVAYVREHNIYVRPADAAPDAGDAVTRSGTAERPFTQSSIAWSPDATRLAAYRVTRGDRRMVRYVQSSPPDQLQPKTFEVQYTKPGDALDRPEPVLIDIAARRETVVDPALFPNPYSLSRLEWRRDGRAFTFDYNPRGHQGYRIVEVDGTSGAARALVDEQTSTFFHYSGRRFRHDVADGAEIIWLSERSGWAHLYLYDGATGRVKHPITSGDWLVRSVVRVDESSRQIWFTAGGTYADQNPYFVHFYRVNFDGTGLTALTREAGDHAVSLSPDRRFYVDTWSRVDQAPISQLRRATDGAVVLDLERADLAPLKAAGWRAPEPFVAKGRDGRTDIWGVIIRPSTFQTGRTYPVIEYIYAGPHDSFAPKNFSAHYPMQSLAELGFIVVQIDGMGTANRSKAFHDVAWQNIGDAGFPDRILWHKAAAEKYPEYDIRRVGIYGGSAGGQNATGALLFHGDFYKVAVSFAGCHDNRMDKIWWNEQWMGWPLGPHYDASSNVVHAKNLKGHLLLIVPELDTNVDPSSTLQVVNALIKANKTFDFLVMPNEEHGGGRRGPSAPYGDRKVWDFFVTHILDAKVPDWNGIASERTTPTGTPLTTSGSLALFGPSWDEVWARWAKDGRDH